MKDNKFLAGTEQKVVLGFPCGSADNISACNVGDLGSIPGFRRSPGGGKGYPLQSSGLENSMDCIVHGVAESQTQLRDFHFHLVKQKTTCPLLSFKKSWRSGMEHTVRGGHWVG